MMLFKINMMIFKTYRYRVVDRDAEIDEYDSRLSKSRFIQAEIMYGILFGEACILCNYRSPSWLSNLKMFCENNGKNLLDVFVV